MNVVIGVFHQQINVHGLAWVQADGDGVTLPEDVGGELDLDVEAGVRGLWAQGNLRFQDDAARAVPFQRFTGSHGLVADTADESVDRGPGDILHGAINAVIGLLTGYKRLCAHVFAAELPQRVQLGAGFGSRTGFSFGDVLVDDVSSLSIEPLLDDEIGRDGGRAVEVVQ